MRKPHSWDSWHLDTPDLLPLTHFMRYVLSSAVVVYTGTGMYYACLVSCHRDYNQGGVITP